MVWIAMLGMSVAVAGAGASRPSGTASGQVAGFLPSADAFRFDNSHWPHVPNYTIRILNHDIGLGDAGDGLCGGMVFTVRDLFEARHAVPEIEEPPEPGSPLFNYIVAGLTRTFTATNIWRFLEGIQSDDATVDGVAGLRRREIEDEWPRVKADIDAGLLSPLGLVHGHESGPLGYVTSWRHLAECHQVLAYAYTVAQSRVSLRIYDPNFPGDEQSLAFDTVESDRDGSLAVSGYAAGRFRGFFRENYSFHDPKTPITCRLVGAKLVSSPGIGDPTPGG